MPSYLHYLEVGPIKKGVLGLSFIIFYFVSGALYREKESHFVKGTAWTVTKIMKPIKMDKHKMGPTDYNQQYFPINKNIDFTNNKTNNTNTNTDTKTENNNNNSNVIKDVKDNNF